jgi:hypothetical protein
MARTIQSPGVEINEIDLSLRPNLPVGTSVLAAGFSDKGPTDEVIQVTSLSEFEQIYGLPTTPAERYFYHSIRPLFNSPANILAYRLPYGSESGDGFGNDYGALVYPASGFNAKNGEKYDSYTDATSGTNVNNGATFILGKPTHFQLTRDQYFKVLKRDGFEWSDTVGGKISTFEDFGKAGMIVLNKGQTTVNNKFEGFYVGVVDNTNMNDATDYDGIVSAETIAASAGSTTSYLTLPTARLNFALSAQNDAATNVFGQESDSISEVLENLTEYDLSPTKFNDTLSVGLFKLRQSVFASDVIKLDYVNSENYVGSLDFHRQIQSQTGGAPQSYFLGFKEDQSPNIEIMVNDNLSHRKSNTWLDNEGIPKLKVRMANSKFSTSRLDETTYISISSQYLDSDATTTGITTMSGHIGQAVDTMGGADSLFTIGAYSAGNIDAKSKNLGSVPAKVERLLDTVENPDIFNIDITIEAGLATINAGREYGDEEHFDDLTSVQSMSGFYKSNIMEIDSTAQTYRDNWKTIYNKFNDFAEKRRKDHIFIADLPRPIFVQGANFKTLDDPDKNFSLHLSKPIQAFTSVLNSSYSTTYAGWSKVYDKVLDDQVWVPFSGTAAELMANTDSNFQPWFAPAGFTRGKVGSVNDIVLYPKQKQRDQLYKNSVNPVAFFPGDGFVVFGQKTLQSAPTAFDRINVRRLFLNLEKATRNTIKYFLFEPNTLLTRTRIINTLTPIFENAKNTEGLYDYLIVCDERNNTPDVIDQNELIVDIYLKPVRAAEFILVNFYATRTGTDFNEIVG